MGLIEDFKVNPISEQRQEYEVKVRTKASNDWVVLSLIVGLDIIMAQYSGRSFDYPEEKLAKTAVIQVVIHEMTGRQG